MKEGLTREEKIEILHYTTRQEISLRRAQTKVIEDYNSLSLWEKIKFAFNKKGLKNHELPDNS